MIIRPNGQTSLFVAQDDHAHQCGEFAGHWKEPVPAGLALAAAIHDNGWIDWDNNPRVNPETHEMYPFVAIPVDQHQALYRRGIRNAIARDTLTGLMVSMHGCGLYNGRYGVLPGNNPKQFSPEDQPSVDTFLVEQKAIQDELRSKLEVPATDEEVASWYALLQLWDVISLMVLTREPKHMTIGPVGNHAAITMAPQDKETVSLSPFPFTTDELVTVVPARRMEQTTFESDISLRQAYHSATVEDIVVRFVRA